MIRVGQIFPRTHPYHRGLVKLSEEVAARTNGAVKVEVFSDAQLGGEVAMVQGMRTGTIDGGVAAVGTFAQTANQRKLYILDMPHLFNTYEDSGGMRIAIRGETAHVGPTPMDRRKNALVGAAHVAVVVDEIGWRYALEDGKTTAARIDVFPNQPGMISDSAELYIDYRHPCAARLKEMEQDLEAAVSEASRRSRTQIEVAERWHFGGLEFDAELVRLVRRQAEKLGVISTEIRSQAGHDAYHLSKICPSVMIFSPCRDGISHNEKEDIALDQTAPAVNVLLHCILERAEAQAQVL